MADLCPLCAAEPALNHITLGGDAPSGEDDSVMICAACETQQAASPLNSEYWRFLTTAMWSEITPVKIIAYRLLHQLSAESWAQDALDIFYIEDAHKTWAEAGMTQPAETPTRDSNGTILQTGDTVTLIKDLPVKGAGFTAKRGTTVRRISLTENPDHIEGRVNGQRIVLVAAFLKKTN